MNFTIPSENQKEYLLLARQSIIDYIKKSGNIDIMDVEMINNEALNYGAFISLYLNGELRGCIGTFPNENSLQYNIQKMSVQAALYDPRFPSISIDELKDVEIEISIISPLIKIESIEEIELGKHGIYIKKDRRKGTFLPQVAKKMGWDLDEFLGHCAKDKAGIGWEGWIDAEIFIYESFVFKEDNKKLL